jgi:hypothetical protein
MTITLTVEEVRKYQRELVDWNNAQLSIALEYVWQNGESLYYSMPKIDAEKPIHLELVEWRKTHPQPTLLPQV